MLCRKFASIWIGLVLLAAVCVQASVAAEKKQAPEGLAGSTLVDADWVKSAMDAKQPLLIIDSRIKDEYIEGHLPGALHLNADDVEHYREVLPSDKDHPVLFYCNGPKCLKSHKAAALAVEWGYRKVYWFRGGIPEWSTLGYPLE